MALISKTILLIRGKKGHYKYGAPKEHFLDVHDFSKWNPSESAQQRTDSQYENVRGMT